MAESLEDRIVAVLRDGPKCADEIHTALGDTGRLCTVFDCLLDMAKQGMIVVGEPLADKRRPYSLQPKPEPLSVWEHHSGRLYRVLYVVNDAIPAKPKYPAMVVYEGAENGKRWAGLLSDWHRRMTLRPDLAEESDTEIRREQESETQSHIANCCHCGRIVDTREQSQGGDAFGAQLTDGRWTCSPECWEAVVDRNEFPSDAASPANGRDV